MPCQRCGLIGGTGLLLLFLLMVCRVLGIVICCYKTFDCAKTFHHSFFHCGHNDSNSRITYTFAVIFELVTVSVLEICRFIFLIFCGKLLLPKWKKLKKKPCRICQIKKLLLPRTLIFFAAFCVSVVRFGAFITYDDLGRMPTAARAIFVLYITDFFLMFVIVIILNYIKIQDLSDCIGYSQCCKYLKHKQRNESANLTWVILKAVILLWCLEYFVYLVLAVFRMTFDVSEVTEKSIDGKSNRHEIVMVLVQFGQIGFTGFVTECLLFKFFDDGEPILGRRTDENERDAWCDFFTGEGTPDERTELLGSGSLPSVYTTCEEYLP